MKNNYIQDYIVVYINEIQRTCEHRLVAADKIGRELKDGEVVHHVNGIKTDNDPDNLEVMSRSDHAILHHRIRFSETHTACNCLFCGKEFYITNRYIRARSETSPRAYCSRSCGAKAQWKRGAVGKVGRPPIN